MSAEESPAAEEVPAAYPTGVWRMVDDHKGIRAPSTKRDTKYTLEEVAKHNHKNDAWIVVNDIVYDMTPHVLHHPGWNPSGGAGQVSTLIAILGACGHDCSDDFNEVHSPAAWKQMPAFKVGVLDPPNPAPKGTRRAAFKSWDQLVAEGIA